MNRASLVRIAAAAALVFFSLGANAQGFGSVSSAVPESTSPATPAEPASAGSSADSGPAAPVPAPAFSSSAPVATTTPFGSSPQATPPVEAPVEAHVEAPAATPATAAATEPAEAPEITVPFGSASSATVAAAPKTSFQPADRVVVKKAERRLYLMRANSIIAEYPIRLGLNPMGHKEREGDFRTPEGTYTLIRRNPRSDFFLSLEVSYPNDADRARAKKLGVRPGGLIMIHGQPNVPRKSPDYYRNFDWTDGCIAVSNSDMVDIWLRTGIGTPIEIRP